MDIIIWGLGFRDRVTVEKKMEHETDAGVT